MTHHTMWINLMLKLWINGSLPEEEVKLYWQLCRTITVEQKAMENGWLNQIEGRTTQQDFDFPQYGGDDFTTSV